MPAPRLLDKRLIAASRATEQKQEIDRGVKIARSVDAIREARVKEEQELERFRCETVATVQREIDAAIGRKNIALKEAEAAEVRKAQAMNATDILELRERLKKESQEHEVISSDLLTRKIILTERENNLSDGQYALSEREISVKDKEESVETNLSDSERLRTEAANAKEEAVRVLRQADSDAQIRVTALSAREKEVDERETAVIARQEELDKEQSKINNEKKLLADRQATLARGFAELRRKQHGSNR